MFGFLKKLFRRKKQLRLFEAWPRGLSIDVRSPFITSTNVMTGASTTIDVLTHQVVTTGPSDTRPEVRPIDVLHELEQPVEIPETNLAVLEKILKERIDFIRDELHMVPENELLRALEICQARKKYPKFAHQFHWKTTVKSKVEELLKKYKLRLGRVSDYIKTVPPEAYTVMEEFIKLQKKVTDVPALFEIIAPADHFKKDPILLAHSPFGEYFYILYAWDKEIEYVEDLLSEEKLVSPKKPV